MNRRKKLRGAPSLLGLMDLFKSKEPRLSSFWVAGSHNPGQGEENAQSKV